MKKLSLILALIFAFACVALASCGETENSSAAESSKVESTANQSSKVPESTKVPESSESSESPESSEASKAPETSAEEPAAPIAITGNVISLGCKYEVPGGKGYVVQDDKWPANYTADLTDGVAVDKLTYDSSWFSFNSEPDMDGESNRIDGVGTVIIDLGEAKNVTGVRTNVYTGNESSIAPVGKVVVWVSDDGETFKNPVSLTIPTAVVGWAEGGFEAVSARYVKVEYTVGGEGHHLFTNEIEVYGN